VGARMSYVHDPVHWRNRARSMRAMAEQTSDANAKAMMLRLADDHAARAESIELPSPDFIGQQHVPLRRKRKMKLVKS
jgi:hypothetical protein